MDDDPVLVSLHEELEREDPRLAALLDGRVSGRRHPRVWMLIALVLVAVPLLLPLRTALGLLAVLAIIASPLAVCWLVASEEGPLPERP
jgi:hypothetical protein